MPPSNQNKKILVIGDEPSDFICPLFKELSENYYLDVNLFEFRKKSRKEELINSIFNKNITLESEIGPLDVISTIFSPFLYLSFFKFFNPKKAIRIAFTEKNVKPIFLEFDVFNFHLLSQNALSYLDFIPKSKKIILSFWGSDLLNPTPNFNPELILKAVKRADAITLHSIEMREIFLSKYGRDLFDKVHIVLILDDTENLKKIINMIPKKETITEKFKSKHNISSNKKLVTIGHSGHDIDDHINVLKSLSLLKEELKEGIAVVLPMTYGCNDINYFKEIKEFCRKNNLSCIILDTFLSEDEIIELRIASEIHIRTPKFDAFSLSLCETFCSDNIIVTGAWLPYSRFRFSGAYFLEIDYYNKLTDLIENILNNFNETRLKHQGNHEKIIKMFNDENSSEKFYKALTSGN
jgi:hypothetical protein